MPSRLTQADRHFLHAVVDRAVDVARPHPSAAAAPSAADASSAAAASLGTATPLSLLQLLHARDALRLRLAKDVAAAAADADDEAAADDRVYSFLLRASLAPAPSSSGASGTAGGLKTAADWLALVNAEADRPTSPPPPSVSLAAAAVNTAVVSPVRATSTAAAVRAGSSPLLSPVPPPPPPESPVRAPSPPRAQAQSSQAWPAHVILTPTRQPTALPLLYSPSPPYATPAPGALAAARARPLHISDAQRQLVFTPTKHRPARSPVRSQPQSPPPLQAHAPSQHRNGASPQRLAVSTAPPVSATAPSSPAPRPRSPVKPPAAPVPATPVAIARQLTGTADWFRTDRLQRAALQHWQAQARAARLRALEQQQKAVAWYAHRVLLVSAWRSWRTSYVAQSVCGRARELQHAVLADSHRRRAVQRRVAAALQHWRQAVVQSVATVGTPGGVWRLGRALRDRAVAAHRTQCLARAVHQWHSAVARTHTRLANRARAAALQRRHLLRRVLSHWCTAAVGARDERALDTELGARADRWWARHRARAMLRHWAQRTALTQQRAIDACAAHRRAVKRRVFRVWLQGMRLQRVERRARTVLALHRWRRWHARTVARRWGFDVPPPRRAHALAQPQQQSPLPGLVPRVVRATRLPPVPKQRRDPLPSMPPFTTSPTTNATPSAAGAAAPLATSGPSPQRQRLARVLFRWIAQALGLSPCNTVTFKTRPAAVTTTTVATTAAFRTVVAAATAAVSQLRITVHPPAAAAAATAAANPTAATSGTAAATDTKLATSPTAAAARSPTAAVALRVHPKKRLGLALAVRSWCLTQTFRVWKHWAVRRRARVQWCALHWRAVTLRRSAQRRTATAHSQTVTRVRVWHGWRDAHRRARQLARAEHALVAARQQRLQSHVWARWTGVMRAVTFRRAQLVRVFTVQWRAVRRRMVADRARALIVEQRRVVRTQALVLRRWRLAAAHARAVASRHAEAVQRADTARVRRLFELWASRTGAGRVRALQSQAAVLFATHRALAVAWARWQMARRFRKVLLAAAAAAAASKEKAAAVAAAQLLRPKAVPSRVTRAS